MLWRSVCLVVLVIQLFICGCGTTNVSLSQQFHSQSLPDDELQALSPLVRTKLRDLSQRIRVQWRAPASPTFKEIDVANELKAICSTSDLIIIIRGKAVTFGGLLGSS